ncbi:MAG TPA: methyltransferase domain-containing protein [Chthoniobacterales bacterium]
MDYQTDFEANEETAPILRQFHSNYYLRINQRRQEHLATLGLPLRNRTVWEVSAGIGDHTTFFLDRGCRVITSDVRPELIALLRQRFPHVPAQQIDLDAPPETFTGSFEVVYAYGVLYHLRQPGPALAYLASRCRNLLLLETCVGYGDGQDENPLEEPAQVASQARSGQGCRPTRRFVWETLQNLFPYTYCPITQPAHEQFPLDWSQPWGKNELRRAVFIGSRERLVLPTLSAVLPSRHTPGDADYGKPGFLRRG